MQKIRGRYRYRYRDQFFFYLKLLSIPIPIPIPDPDECSKLTNHCGFRLDGFRAIQHLFPGAPGNGFEHPLE